MEKTESSPFCIVAIPLSHPFITRDIPIGNVVVERGRGHPEHAGDVRRAGNIPRADVLVEEIGLVKRLPKIGHTGSVPTSDVAAESPQIKHAIHRRHARHVPGTDVLIEVHEVGTGPVAEDLGHVCHRGGVPFGDVVIERGLILEYAAHGGHGARVPVADRAVRACRGRRIIDPRRRGSCDVCVRDARKRMSPEDAVRRAEHSKEEIAYAGGSTSVANAEDGCSGNEIREVIIGICNDTSYHDADATSPATMQGLRRDGWNVAHTFGRGELVVPAVGCSVGRLGDLRAAGSLPRKKSRTDKRVRDE